MSWHHDKRVDDAVMRHPADSMAWKQFDELHPSFVAEPRNVRLGLASDGFQPFGMSKTPYSIWPVCYMGHRRYLPLSHKWRNDKASFDNTIEHMLPPEMLSGDDILDQVADLDGLPLTKDPQKKIKISHKKRERNYDGGVIESEDGLTIFCEPGKSLKGSTPDKLDSNDMKDSHFYILKNCDEIQPFLEFHVKEYDQYLKTQNYGVVVVGETGEEQNHMDYYGELTERGVKMDEYGFVSVNRRRYLKINEPFVKASQASQVDMNPSKTLKYEMGQASKIPKHELIQPGALAKGLGQSLKSMSTIRVNAERRTPIAKNRSYYTTTSKLNKLADNSFHVHPCFEEKEDNAPLHQEAEMNQYTLTSDARSQGQSLRINAEKRIMIGENRNTTTTSSQSTPAKKSIPVPPDFNPMEDNDTLFLETEVTRDTQRSDHLQKSPFESRKAKEVVGVAQGSKGNKNSPVGYDKAEKMTEVYRDVQRSLLKSKKAKKVIEVAKDATRNETSPCEYDRTTKVRGTNIRKKFLRLRPGEKVKVTFYQNRVVGPNHTSFTRHLGLLVRDRNMCPLRVHSWMDIKEHKLEHMWVTVTEKFDCDNMNDQRDNVLQHIRKLWNNWRGSLHKNMKSKSLHEVLKDVPIGVDKSDWEWLVKEHFLSKKFKESSTRNTINRSKLCMPHRTGSKPIREIIYELGGKDGNPPNMETIFFETRKKGNKLVEPETNEKYAEIQELVQSEPSLTNIEVVERCFGPQCKSHAVGFGGGITTKELKGGSTSKAALLEKLKITRKEKESLQKRIDILESKYDRLESIVVCQHPSPTSPPPDFEVQATSLPFASRGDEYASRPPSRPCLGTFFPFGI
ncbi:hypothetical protein KY290_035217 [Solanum tuberosum]|uniref:TNP2-like transposon protein n=1 Tax=Solanum tuberosum TaxID=4113 RepID=A0ABQ7U7F1_SOLTU|nr:hypothetical protein KY289_034740 [Solanum tuberosum]KAH0742174.1 hypothetical protein KY290_035217 [Solanum tuberosum]